jgi:hypothetical protein
MPKKYCLVVLVLGASGISVAKADQKDNQATTAASTNVAVSAPAASTASSAATAVKKPRSKKAPVSVVASPSEDVSSIDDASATAATVASAKGEADKAATIAAPALTDQPMFKFGGFGTLGFSHSSQDQGDYVLDSSMPTGAGRSKDWSPGNNTRAAAHMTADFAPKISAILQVDSEYRADGSYRPEVEWLNVKYAFTPNAYVRIGRIALPTFMDSESRDVGYGYAWVNPPVDLYRQLSIPSSDGVDVMYRTEIGEAGNTIKAIYGQNKEKGINSLTTSNSLWGIFDTLEYGSATFHVSYQERRSSTQNFLTGVTGAWADNSDLSVGASYDPGNWFVISEWVQHRSSTKVNAMYVSGGYRIDKFTPYLLYSQNSPGSFLSSSTAPTASAIDRANRSQSTASLGMRWDFMRNYDFKIQYDQVRLSSNSNGYLANVPTGVILYGSKFHVISAVVDFVF